MALVIASVIVFAATLLLQRVPGGFACDVVMPLLTAVGLVARRPRALWWSVAAGFFYAAFTRLPPLAVARIWLVLVAALGAVARGAEWERLPVAFLVAVLVSLVWQVAALTVGSALGMAPTMDRMAWSVLVCRPLTAGLLFIAFFHPLLRIARPPRPLRAR